MVHGRGDRGMAGGTPHHTGRPAALFGSGDHDSADDARGLPPGITANRRAHGSVIALLGLDLTVPDHSTMSRRSKTLEMPPLRRSGPGPLHLLVDSTGLKLGGAGEWLVEKHGTSRRRSWRKLHLGVEAESGEIVAIELTRKEIDDAARSGALLDQITDPVASFTADGAYDQDKVYEGVAEHVRCRRHRAATFNSNPERSAKTAPTQPDQHIQEIAERGRMGWQNPVATTFGPRSRRRSVDTNA